MNKICGYNCEHNKGGVCQIIYCNKIGKMTTTTQEPELLTRWIDPTIEEKDNEIEKLNNIIYIKTNRIQQLMKRLSKRQEKVDRLNNIIDEIRKIVKHEKEELDKFKGVDLLINTYQQVFGVMLEMLELKEGNKNE